MQNSEQRVRFGRRSSRTARSSMVFWMLSGLLVAGFCVQSARAGTGEIYVLTADDGSVSLSNVPTALGYRLLIGDEVPALAPGSAQANAMRRPARLRDPASKARFDEVVEQTARAYGLESALLHAVISVESGYNAAAVSPKGASGLMQLMPKTALRYGVANRLDATQSLHGGAKYLRDLVKLFNSDLKLVLAAYNAGEGAVARHGNKIPPYPETMAYVPRVLDYYQHYQSGGGKPTSN